MPGKRDYMPKKDGAFFSFQRVLVTKVEAKKAVWGIPDPAVDVLTSHRLKYEPLYHKSQNKNRRNTIDVLAHRDERQTYEKDIRAFVNAYIRFNGLISDSQRLSLGLLPRDTKPTPKPKINGVPMVGLEPKGGGFIEVRCRTETDQTRDSMHKHADVIEVMFVMVPAHPPVKAKDLPEPEECPRSRTSTKAHFIIKCGAKNAGLRFYGFFRWANLTNPDDSGPWSNARTVVVA